MTAPRQRPPLRLRIKGNPDYWQRLGQFIEAFAETEAFLFAYFMRSAPIPDVVARVLLERAHTPDLIKHLRSIWKAAPWVHPEKDELDDVLGQLQSIARVRNNLMHYASRPASKGDRITSDIVRAVDVERPREFTVSVETLSNMIADLERICFHLAAYMASPNLPADERLTHFPELRGTWRYKVPSPQEP